MTNFRIYLILFTLWTGFLVNTHAQITIGATLADTSTLVSNLDTPWEILWGPDDHIWFTERQGKVSRLDPESGELTELIRISQVHEQGESGLLGMALHPDFNRNPFVFLVYNYLESGSIKERVVKYTYENNKLNAPVTLLEEIGGAGNHNGSRLIIDSDLKLYISTGDAANTSTSQNLNSLSGKILRMNLDGSIPDDNPISGSYIWTWGHRNPQGLVISPQGIMYSSEHGPSSDDELNIIEKGRNYGWPDVKGFCNEVTESPFCDAYNVFEPLAAWTPTLAVAGTDYYPHAAIQEWQNSVLVTSLKAGRLVALKLSDDMRSVIKEEAFFSGWFGRMRDICISPDGRVFLATSNRDGRGTVRIGDDRIVEISAINTTSKIRLNTDPSLLVFPNPLSGKELSIEYTTNSDAVLIIYNPSGVEISRDLLSPNQNKISLSLPDASGVYFIKMINKTGVRGTKVLKF